MSQQVGEHTQGVARARTRGAPDRRATHSDRTIVLSLDAFGWTIAFVDCPEVVEGLEAILSGWRVRRLPSAARQQADAQVQKTRTGFAWRSKRMPRPQLWDEHPPITPMQVLCDVHDVLFDWFLKANPRHLCLHGAAVRIGGGGLVCFPSVQKTGKSTLSVALAARGHTVYGDDVLAIEPRESRGAALGMAPRLRKPLPENIGSRLLRFVRERAGPSDRRWVYVELGKGEIAPLGDAVPITAFVLLQRGTGRAKLEPVRKSEMLKEILLQNFARQVPPVETLDRLTQLTERVRCYRLRYDSVAGAARLIEQRFGREPAGRAPTPRSSNSGRESKPRAPTKSGRQHEPNEFRRAPGVETREVGGETFVAAPGPKTIHHLDRMASAAWRVLSEPKNAEELIALFAAAFPDMPLRRIQRDVNRLLAFLEASELIVKADTRRRPSCR